MKRLSRYLHDLVWDHRFLESIKSVEYAKKYISNFHFQITMNFIEFN